MKILPLTAAIAVAALGQSSLLAPSASAQNTSAYTTVYKFMYYNNPGLADVGREPRAGLTLGPDGKFYGTTYYGGNAPDKGTVFSVTPAGVVTILHDFNNATGDGSYPEAELLLGSDGRFYGTTVGGGDPTDASGRSGEGTVFAITPGGVETILYRFNTLNGHGNYPYGGLVEGPDGKLYGTTVYGGDHNDGTIFSLTKTGVITTLHSFNYASGGPGSEGLNPGSTLALGPDGKFYGTTRNGGVPNRGTIFSVTSTGEFKMLHVFSEVEGDGASPFSGLTVASDGQFYGTTEAGGVNGGGTVYSMTTDGTVKILYSFPYGGSDTSGPRSRLVQASDGKLYGTSFGGGVLNNSDGTVYSITTNGVFNHLHLFNRPAGEGFYCEDRLVQGSDGFLYGTTQSGDDFQGSVFKIGLDPVAVNPPSSFFSGELALSNGVFYLKFPEAQDSAPVFGYYSFLNDPHYIYHFDLGYEYVFDAQDGNDGVYLYDFKSNGFFYTSPYFPFPYLYDFSLNTTLYYYPDPGNPGRYNTNGYRFFYRFDTGEIIVK